MSNRRVLALRLDPAVGWQAAVRRGEKSDARGTAETNKHISGADSLMNVLERRAAAEMSGEREPNCHGKSPPPCLSGIIYSCA